MSLKCARRLWHACLWYKTKACLIAEASNRHLTLVERCKIDALLSRGLSFRAIGRELGFAHTTIAREVKRNHVPDGHYEAQAADAMAVK